MATPYSSDAPAWSGVLKGSAPSVSDARVQEILDDLNSMVVYEYEGGTEIANGRAVITVNTVGADPDLGAMFAAAVALPEFDWGVEDGTDSSVTLSDGTVLEWMPAEYRWSAVSTLPGGAR
jgi:hypothetical protein